MKAIQYSAFVIAAILIALALLVVLLLPPALPVPDRASFTLRDVTAIQPGEFRREHRDITVRDGRIVSIEPARPALTSSDIPDGGFVMPGLVDLHVHHPPRLAAGQRELWSLLFLAHGVTAVRDIGDIDDTLGGLKARIESGDIVGPAITRCGVILDGDPPSFPSNFRVTTPEAAYEKVRAMKAEGVDCIKVYTMIGKDVLRAIQHAAKIVDLPVLGHLPHSVSLEEAGLGEVQHFMGIPLVDYEKAGRNESSLSDWAELTDARIARQILISRRDRIEHLPTLFNVYRRNWQLDDSRWQDDSGLRHMPRFWSGVWQTLWGPPYRGERERKQREVMVARWRELIMRMHEQDVMVHLGTDALMPFVAPGSSLHGEIELFVEVGLPVEEVLYRVTTHAGTHMNPPTGRLEVGYPADLLVLDEDPVANLAALRRPRLVVAGGRKYSRAQLEQSLARFDAHFLEGYYPAVMDVLVLGIQELFRR